MRILHVIPGMANASGPSHVVASLAAQFCRRGHECSIFYVTGRGANQEVPVALPCDVQGFPAIGLRNWAYSPTLQQELYQSLTKFDVVHLHSMWLYPNIAVCRAARRAGVPYIVRPAGSLEPWSLTRAGLRKRFYMRMIERRIVDHAAALHAMSEKEADGLKRFAFQAPIVVLPNGHDLHETPMAKSYPHFKKRLGVPNDRKVILFLSRLHEGKGLDVLGEAFTLVRKAVPDAFLVIAGPNRHRFAHDIRTRYARLGIDKDCRFVGEVSGDDKWSAFQSAEVFVLPSRSENFGVVVLEALSAGLPVVVSQNAPWSVVEEEGAGFWVQNSPQIIADRLINILTNPALRADMSRRAVELVRTRFSWAAAADSLERVYENIIAGRNPNADMPEPTPHANSR